ncbi:MAG: methyltransferase domain-containing protein [candidate division KSB1 bacterium]
MIESASLSPQIRAFYEKYDEAGRLATGAFQLEHARTQELLTRYLPAPPAMILDVGGGPGIYAAWLAQQKYEVHLVDPIDSHLAHARKLSTQQVATPIMSITSGDARALQFADHCADAVLMLGPLYHLIEKKDRLAALHEARRALKPGGVLCVAIISRFASGLEGLFQNTLGDPTFAEIVRHDLTTGHHRNPTENIFYFTEAYFHHPQEIAEEISAAGLNHEHTLALEGPGWLLQDFAACWNDATRREQMLQLVRQMENEPSLLGASAHIMAIARKG